MKTNIFKTKTLPMTTIGGHNAEAISDYSDRKHINTRSINISGSNFSDTILTTTLNFVIDGGTAAITTGIKGDIMIPFNCTIQNYTLLGNISGSLVIDIWKDTYANFPPTDADAMPGAGKEPTITSSSNSQDLSITDWASYTINAGDILRFNVDSCTNISGATLVLNLRRT